MYFNDLLLICPTCSFKSTIHVSLHILIIYLNIWYYVQYVLQFYFYYPVFIFSVYFYYYLNLLYRPFIYYYKRLTLWEFLNCHTTQHIDSDDSTVSIGLKPPFHKFPINISSPTYEIFFILINFFSFFYT